MVDDGLRLGSQPGARGAVTIDNPFYGGYAGETQLLRFERPTDPRITVAGHVESAGLPRLDPHRGGVRLVLFETTS